MLHSKFVMLVVTFAITLSLPVHAETPEEIIENTRYLREIHIPSGWEPGLSHIMLDQHVFDMCDGDLSSIRLLDHDNIVRPYAIRKSTATFEETDLGATVLNRSQKEDGSTRVDLDLGNGVHKHNRLYLTTSADNFFRKVFVEGSHNREDWWILRQNGLIFAYNQDQRNVNNLSIKYPQSDYRFIRVTVEGGEKPVEIKDASIRLVTETGIAYFSTAHQVNMEIEQLKNPGRTRYLIDTKTQGVPYSHAEILTSGSNFHREVELFSGNDPQKMETIGESYIYSYFKDEGLAKKLDLTFDEQHDRYFALEIFHHDNQPLEIINISLEAAVRYLFFDARPDEILYLYYGGNKVEKPEYDFEKTHAKLEPDVTRITAIKPPGQNPNYRRDPAGMIQENMSWILVIFIVLAVLILSVLVRSNLKKIPPSHEHKTE